jgi:hypothetical protein
MATSPEILQMIYGVDPADIESYVTTNMMLQNQESLTSPSGYTPKLFMRFIAEDILFDMDANGVPPYRVIRWHFDANGTCIMTLLSSDSPLSRYARLHANTVKRYNLTRFDPERDTVIFAFNGQKAYTSQYRELQSNYNEIYKPQQPINDIIKLLGTMGQVFAPALNAIPGFGNLLAPTVSNISSAMLGQRIYYRTPQYQSSQR